MVTHRQRLETCLSGQKPDRVPITLWRHFPVDDQRAEKLAAATLAFQKTFDFDLVKVSPASSFSVKDWGSKDEWRGATEGTREYTQWAIKQPEDWGKLAVLDPHKGYLGAQLECLKMLKRELDPDTPFIQTIFNPLSQVKYLVGAANLTAHLRQYPDALHEGLKTITESTIRFIEAAIQTGISGVFFAVQHAQYSMLTHDEYKQFGQTYDLQALEATKDLWLNMVHLHGMHVMFDIVSKYPVQIINWHDRETYPSLKEGKKLFPGVVCGGLTRERSIVYGDAEQVEAEAREAILATEGQRLLLGTGCVVPIIAPYGNIMAARKSVEMR